MFHAIVIGGKNNALTGTFLKSIVSISPDKMPKKMIRKEETKPDGKNLCLSHSKHNLESN